MIDDEARPHAPSAESSAADSSRTAENPMPAAGPADWMSSLSDDARSFVRNKGWDSPAEVLSSYRHLERLVGGNRLVLPRDEDDDANWGRVWNRLGRPETPDGYELPVPENGGDGALAKAFAMRAHELGLTSKQARGLAEWWNSTAAKGAEHLDRQRQSREEAEIATLRDELGSAFDGEAASARRAAALFGFDAATLSSIESAIGTAAMIRRFMAIGRALGEDQIEGGADTGFGPSVEAARARIEELKADPAWTKRYLDGDGGAKSEFQRLMRAAYPEG